MNRKDFKRILKPLIKECIKEVIFEDGVLSTVITEVVKGTQTTKNSQPTLQVEKKQEATFVNQREILEEKYKAELERRRKLLEASGFDGIDIFEGTEPLREGGNPGNSSSSQGMFSDLPAGDAGVDISALMGVGNGENWKKLARNK
jgi:hypothetical protein